MMNTLTADSKPELTVLFGQPDIYSTSFQTSRLAAALEPWFTLRLIRVPNSRHKSLRALKRFVTNYVGPGLTRPKTDCLLYCNDGAANLAHWRAMRAIYWYDAPWDWSVRAPSRRDWVQRLRFNNISLAEQVFAVSAAQVRVAQALRPGRESSVHYLPVGVDCRVFDPALADPERPRRQFALPAGKIVVGYLGYLGFFQGRFAGEVLLEAALDLIKEAGIHLFVVGFGPALGLWKERVEKLGIAQHVTFSGFVADELIPHCLSAMDICIDTLEPGFHSEARSETKLKQYMAMGRACVATAIGENCVDLEGGRCGILAEPGVGPLQRAIRSLLDDPAMRRQVGTAARARACAVYDWPVLAQQFAQAIGRD